MQHVKASTCVYFFRDATCHAWTVTHIFLLRHVYQPDLLGFRSVGDNAITPTRAKAGKPWMVGMRLALPYFPCPNMLGS